MKTDPLQTREVFHLAFLRALARSVPVSTWVVKGGCNLRFYFGSIRYSEDMDLDVSGLPVHTLREKVITVLNSSGLTDTLRIYGIDRVQPPEVTRAKQTETVQRFKIHLFTTGGEDLFTKVEFSRRGFDSPVLTESVSPPVLAAYRMPPLIAPHYGAAAAVRQKVHALVTRRQPEARDVFDLYTLSSRLGVTNREVTGGLSRRAIPQARERIYAIGYEQYRDTVISFLGPEDRAAYDSSQFWDEIRLRAVSTLEQRVHDEE
jgi:predicted nucleotidyltransferase component of viral defense system